MNKKKTIIVLVSIIFISIISYAVYYFNEQNNQAVPANQSEDGSQAVTRFGSFKPLSGFPNRTKSTLAIFTNSENQIVYFNIKDLSFYRVNKDSQVSKFASLDYEPYDIIYSLDGTKALLLGAKNDLFRPIEVLDFSSEEKYVLNKYIINAAISPSGDQLVYNWHDQDNRESNISVSGIDGTNWEKLIDFEFVDYEQYIVRWVDSKNILIMPLHEEVFPVTLVKMNIETKIKSDIATDRFLDFMPSPSGLKLAAIVEKTAENNILGSKSIVLIDLTSKAKKEIFINTNLSQSVWAKSSNKIYAVGTYRGSYGLYSVDAGDNIVNTITNDIPENTRDISQLALSEDEKFIYVISNGAAYGYEITK